MDRLRFSMATLLGAVAAIAVGLGALRAAGPLVASAVFSLLWLVLILALIGFLCSHGHRRVFCGSFVLSAFIYLALVRGPWLYTAVGNHLITKPFLNYLHSKLATLGSPPFDSSNVVVWVRRDGSIVLDGEVIDPEEAMKRAVKKSGPIEMSVPASSSLAERVQRAVEKSGAVEVFLWGDEGPYPNGRAFQDAYNAARSALRVPGLDVTGASNRVKPEYYFFETVGDSLFSLCIGLIGGAVGVWFASWRPKSADSNESDGQV